MSETSRCTSDPLARIDAELRAIQKRSKSLRWQGHLMAVPGLVMVALTAPNAFGVPWWAAVLAMLPLGALAFGAGMLIGRRMFDRRFGDIMLILRQMRSEQEAIEKSQPSKDGFDASAP